MKNTIGKILIWNQLGPKKLNEELQHSHPNQLLIIFQNNSSWGWNSCQGDNILLPRITARVISSTRNTTSITAIHQIILTSFGFFQFALAPALPSLLASSRFPALAASYNCF